MVNNMAKNIEPKLIKIGDYLKLEKGTAFTIPEYQRAYSWEIENCDKMWQDIFSFCENKASDAYFFGTIIINCRDNDSKYDLIDGQQRTTTFLLLLKALLLKVNEEIKKSFKDEDSTKILNALKERRRKITSVLYHIDPEDVEDVPDDSVDSKICGSFKLLQNNSNNERFKEEIYKILKATSFAQVVKETTKIKNKQKDNKFTNFFKNFKYFYKRLSDLTSSSLNSFAKTFTDKCEIIEIKSWNFEQAINMFNSLNSDGLPLSDSDIIHAKLYAKAKALNIDSNFSSKWMEFLDEIKELDQNGIANINSILMQRMYYERAYKQEIKGKNEGKVNVTTPGLRKYYLDSSQDILDKPLDLCDSLINLVKLWKIAYLLPETKILCKLNENSRLFLGVFLQRFDLETVKTEYLTPFVEDLLKLFTVLELVDLGYSSNAFKVFLFSESLKLVDKNISIDIISDDFKKHIKNEWNKNVIKSLLKDYKKNVLVYLNEYLFSKEKFTSTAFDILPTFDVEHIMPCSGANLQTIRKDAGIEDEYEFDDLVNKLGNKILLERKINRSIGNEWFKTKVSTTLKDKSGYINSNCPVAKSLVDKYKDKTDCKWTKDDIDKSTELVADRIVKFIFGS